MKSRPRLVFTVTRVVVLWGIWLLAARVAQAQNAPWQATLRDGSIYRGELVEMTPNDHISLKLATGEVKRFGWSDLAGTPGPVVEIHPVAPRRIEGPRVTVNSNDVSAGLYRRSGVGSVSIGFATAMVDDLSLVCPTPCGDIVDARVPYVIAGPYINTSRDFLLPASAASVRLDVRTGSRSARRAGQYLAVLGVAPILVGSILIVLGKAEGSFGSIQSAGVGTLVVGAGLLATGITLVATSGTRVKIETGDHGAQISLGAVRLDASGLRF